MLLVAADTSGKHGSIALARGDVDGSCCVIETVSLEGSAFSAQLVPQISSLLSEHRFDKKEIGGFVVVSGPGSFTGLRVGLAAVKALAEVLVKPIAAVSLLEAVATASEFQGDILTALDAGRQQVYVGEYNVSYSGMIRLSERSMTRDGFVNVVSGAKVVTPDPGVAEIARSAGAAVQIIEIPRADVIARFGWKKILSGETLLPDQLEANYMSRSDGDIFSKRL
jgi:tRNA threonylcarbamoyladenosine biosynthesis protein TsaB